MEFIYFLNGIHELLSVWTESTKIPWYKPEDFLVNLERLDWNLLMVDEISGGLYYGGVTNRVMSIYDFLISSIIC